MKKKVIARVFIKEDAIDAFKKIANAIIRETRNEDGCILYNLYQEVLVADEFVFVEEYKNQEALDIHFKSEYLTTFVEAIKDLQSKEMILEVI